MISERILIFGATGMLGSMLFKCFSAYSDFETFGIVRDGSLLGKFNSAEIGNIEVVADVLNPDVIRRLLYEYKPTVAINCIGIVKQLEESLKPLLALPVNSIFPHQLEMACSDFGCRLIHFSTDCVFSGSTGNYREDSFVDARDLYGLSKFMGEVNSSNSITLRTSIIGHELSRHSSLLDWFLAKQDRVDGYKNAIFSGLTTREIYNVIVDYVLPKKSLSGLFHLASHPISKFDLLKNVSAEYEKAIEIVPCQRPIINRSLDSTRFNLSTGYMPKSWPEQLNQLHSSSIYLGGYCV